MGHHWAELYIEQHSLMWQNLLQCLSEPGEHEIHRFRLCVKKMKAFGLIVQCCQHNRLQISKRMQRNNFLAGRIRDLQLLRAGLGVQYCDSQNDYNELINWSLRKEAKLVHRLQVKNGDLENCQSAEKANAKIMTKIRNVRMTDDPVKIKSFFADLEKRIVHDIQNISCESDLHSIRVQAKYFRYMIQIAVRLEPDHENSFLISKTLRTIEIEAGRCHDSWQGAAILKQFLHKHEKRLSNQAETYHNLLKIMNTRKLQAFEDAQRIIQTLFKQPNT